MGLTCGGVLLNNNRPRGVVSDDRRLADGQLDEPGHLVVDAHDDLALVLGLVRPLHVLDLQRVRRARRIVPHTASKKIQTLNYM